MIRWQYKATDHNGEIYTGTIPMPEDDPVAMFLQIQKLRTKLAERRYQFIEARELTKQELRLQAITNVLKKRRDRHLIIEDSHISVWRYVVFLVLALLPILLLAWWSLYR